MLHSPVIRRIVHQHLVTRPTWKQLVLVTNHRNLSTSSKGNGTDTEFLQNFNQLASKVTKEATPVFEAKASIDFRNSLARRRTLAKETKRIPMEMVVTILTKKKENVQLAVDEQEVYDKYLQHVSLPNYIVEEPTS